LSSPYAKNPKEFRGADKMPKPLEAARILSSVVGKVLEYENGSFLDVRDLE
jgi:hypothetical protein